MLQLNSQKPHKKRIFFKRKVKQAYDPRPKPSVQAGSAVQCSVLQCLLHKELSSLLVFVHHVLFIYWQYFLQQSSFMAAQESFPLLEIFPIGEFSYRPVHVHMHVNN